MNKEQLSLDIGKIDDDVLQDTIVARSVSIRRFRRRWVAVAACLCLLAVSLLTLPLWQRELPSVQTPPSGQEVPSVQKLAVAAYPAQAPRPAENVLYDDPDSYYAWLSEVATQRQSAKKQSCGMTTFYADTMETFLDGKPGENRVYSPLNVYFALAMLAECADGNSRRQILDLLGVADLPALRAKCNGLWQGVYTDDGAATCRLANSLWLAQGDEWSYDTATVQRLAEDYFASSFEGVMGSNEYNEVLRNWLNEQTDDLLQEQAGTVKFDRHTALALASTVCLRIGWNDVFLPENTTPGVFHTAEGEVACEFMNRSTAGAAYFGDNFNAVRLGLDTEYAMYIALPDDGVSVDTLIDSDQLLSILQDPEECGLGNYTDIIMRIPKFDVVSDQDLVDGLRSLGVTDVLDEETADFGGILTEDNEPVYLNRAQHAARVAIDEEGVIAAAYTVELIDGAGAPEKELQFIVDRPFFFAITGPGNTILFSGIVENPG